MITKRSFLTALVLASVAAVFIFSPSGALAVRDPRTVKEGIDVLKEKVATKGSGLARDESVTPLLVRIINWLLIIVAFLAMLAMVVGGIMYIISFGSEERAKSAKRIIIYALIGLALVIASYAILTTVRTLIAPPPPLLAPPP